jgi:hypothetical protein
MSINMGVYFKEDDGKRTFKNRHKGNLMVVNEKITFINRDGDIIEMPFNNIDRIELVKKYFLFFYLKDGRMCKCMPFADSSSYTKGANAGMFLAGIQGANLGGTIARDRSVKRNALGLYNQLNYLIKELSKKNEE